MARIDQYLKSALEQSASDLHFLSGDPVRARIHGNLQAISDDKLAVDTVDVDTDPERNVDLGPLGIEEHLIDDAADRVGGGIAASGRDLRRVARAPLGQAWH